ncbi:MerR family transcriptional regulator [Acidaminobacter sp. JC074]|uniref:MerR family transcriptional regulator n=1 Tax=Acidaminobacter sp. JC074 TaxID=2530199 RepID=UPI001F0EF552|nr:MerR family transcriptional regulator [Acidaminobacter sp. JC074]MCH4888084.1 MerR family transcriptional regulator [Acidaminobacter sp. JC074]
MYTVGKLSKQFKLSRSTLLYYDKIGLLSPSERSESNYRLYSEEDVERLKMIVRHRAAGIPLDDIKKLFNIKDNSVSEILSGRLKSIQNDIALLKKQENMILAVLIDEVILNDKTDFNRTTWSQFLIDSGYTDEDLREWHKKFELESQSEHRLFLNALGMDEKDVDNLLKILNLI